MFCPKQRKSLLFYQWKIRRMNPKQLWTVVVLLTTTLVIPLTIAANRKGTSESKLSNKILNNSFSNEAIKNQYPSVINNIQTVSYTSNLPEKSISNATQRIFRGLASWYGPGFHNKKTANGEKFNKYLLTAAHRSLPFGTLVRVTNTNNGNSVIVRINDRGPYIRDRIIDLSKAAAQALEMQTHGLALVELEPLEI